MQSNERILLVALSKFSSVTTSSQWILQCSLSHKTHLMKLQQLSLNHQLGTLKLQSLSFWRSQQSRSYFSAYHCGCLHTSFSSQSSHSWPMNIQEINLPWFWSKMWWIRVLNICHMVASRLLFFGGNWRTVLNSYLSEECDWCLFLVSDEIMIIIKT